MKEKILQTIVNSFTEEVFSSKAVYYYTIINMLAIIGLVVIAEYTDIDLVIQKNFYHHKDGWFIDRSNQLLKLVFYIAPKRLVVMVSLLIIALNIYFWFGSRKDSKYQEAKRILFYVFLSMLISIVSVSLLKQVTNMYCPDSIEIFNGKKPYVKLFEEFPIKDNSFKQGKCYPAGQASGGFALLAFILIIKRSKFRYLIAIGILLIGWIMGGYQIMKGAHYFSDTFVTMLLTFLISLICYQIVLKHKF